MPRNGSGVYSLPANTRAGPPNTPISSTKANSVYDDIAADLNAARPVVAGGTGGATAADARTNLGVENRTVYSAKTGAYTAVSTDNAAILRFTATATLSLDPAATLAANWHTMVIADGGAVTVDPNSSETIDGAATLIIPDGYSAVIVCSGAAFFTNKLMTKIQTKADSSAVGSFIDGLLLSNNTGSPTTHVDFAAGSARSGSSFVSSATSFTKRVTGTWAVGTGNGGLDAGSVAASATYFAYALRKDSDLSFDVVLSTSATIGGVTTTLLTGYTIVKQIGVVLTDASSLIRAFTMYPRDEYTFTTPVKDAINVAISTTSALLALTVPNGVKAKAKLRFEFTSSAATNAALLSDPAQGTLIAGIATDGSNVGAIQVASGFAVGSQEIWTNTSRQIRQVTAAAGNLWVWTDGFYFPCGRNA